MRPPLNRLSAAHLARMLAAGEVNCEAVTHSFLDAIEQRESEVRAFTWIDPKRALRLARELDKKPALGPLRGLPLAVKDVIDTAGVVTEYGSPIYAGHVPSADAACVAAARAAGSYVLGKTVTAELANFAPGPTRNPHAPEHTPGGSSSGSAAAVAARMAPFALGTQTAGSVIRPASFCGVVGFVPTRGSVPRAGARQVSDTLDVIGCFANTVEDAALLASALMSRSDLMDTPGESRVPLIGWTATPWASQLTPTMLGALERVVRLCSINGATVREIKWGDKFTVLADAQRTVQVFETARSFAAEFDYRRRQLSPQLAALIEEGRAIGATSYLTALQTGRDCAASIDALFGDADVVLTPSAPGEAPHGLGSTGDPQFNRPWHLLGAPQINVPVPRALLRSKSDLPLGVQVVGRPRDDVRTLRAAHWLEQQLERLGA
ncbi:MAG TPA: amidase [Burkholderiaceae bacterium]|nr:amidase [Burkholderiaceae bacterium]